jgi:uncharacterized membrane protein YcaP (DUF421 family)
MSPLEQVFVAPGSQLNAWQVIPRTVILFVVAIAYVRVAKKRFMAQASALDLVVAIVFGSMLSRAINGSGSLASCLSASLALVVLHRLLDRWACQWPRFEALVKGHSNILVRAGVPDREAMKFHAITDEDLMSEMRTIALTDRLDEVRLAVLERSGRISIVKYG